MKLSRYRAPGRLSNGYARDAGSVLHLVPNPDACDLTYYSQAKALCGKVPRLYWASPNGVTKVCPKCSSAAAKVEHSIIEVEA